MCVTFLQKSDSSGRETRQDCHSQARYRHLLPENLAVLSICSVPSCSLNMLKEYFLLRHTWTLLSHRILFQPTCYCVCNHSVCYNSICLYTFGEVQAWITFQEGFAEGEISPKLPNIQSLLPIVSDAVTYIKLHASKCLRQSNTCLFVYMRGSRKFCQRGSKFDNVFLVDEGIEDPNITINGPSSAYQRNTI